MKLTTTPAELSALVKAAAPAASRDKLKPHLAGVHIETSTDGFTMTATDGYRAHLVSALHAADSVGEYGEVLLPAPALVAVAKTVTKYGKTPGALVTITNDNGHARVDVVVNGAPVMSETVETLGYDLPPVATLFDEARVSCDEPNTDPAVGVGFNAALIAAAFTAADVIASDSYVSVGNLRGNKPAYIRATNHATFAGFEALVMPRRAK